MRALADALEFPEYFGRNWDAVEDCIRDLSWKPAPGYLLIYNDGQVLGECCPKDLDILVDVGHVTGDEWRQHGVTFHVLLTGPEGFQNKFREVLGREICKHQDS